MRVLFRRENLAPAVSVLGVVLGFVVGQLTGQPIGGLVGATVGATVAVAANAMRVRRTSGRQARAATWLAERASRIIDERVLFGSLVAHLCDPVEPMSLRDAAAIARGCCIRVNPECADPVWRAPANQINSQWQGLAQLVGQVRRDVAPDVDQAQRELQQGLADTSGAAHKMSLAWRDLLRKQHDNPDGVPSVYDEISLLAEEFARGTADVIAAANKLERLARRVQAT